MTTWVLRLLLLLVDRKKSLDASGLVTSAGSLRDSSMYERMMMREKGFQFSEIARMSIPCDFEEAPRRTEGLLPATVAADDGVYVRLFVQPNPIAHHTQSPRHLLQVVADKPA